MIRLPLFIIILLIQNVFIVNMAFPESQITTAKQIIELFVSQKISVWLGDFKSEHPFPMFLDRKYIMDLDGCMATIKTIPIWLTDEFYQEKIEFDLKKTKLQNHKKKIFLYCK